MFKSFAPPALPPSFNIDRTTKVELKMLDDAESVSPYSQAKGQNMVKRTITDHDHIIARA